MVLATNITRRSGSKSYYARIVVPRDIKKQFGKTEVWISLKTHDPAEAKRRARPVFDDFDRRFAALRAKTTLSDHELQSAIWDRYGELVRADQQRRLELPTDDELEDIWKALVDEFGDDHDMRAWGILQEIANEDSDHRVKRLRRLATLRADVAKGEIKSVSHVVADVAEVRGLHIPSRSHDERKLAHHLQRAEIEALTRASERDRGEFGGVIKDQVVAPPASQAPMVAAPGEGIMELFDVFARDNPNGSTRETLQQSKTVLKLFSDFVGKQFPAAKIGKKEVREWKAGLRDYPIKATEMAVFRGKDFRQTIESNRKLKKPTISDKTLNRYLAAVGSYCKWLVAHGYLNEVPTAGMFIKVDKSRQKVRPYTPDELKSIFSSPLYIGCQSESKPHLPGNIQVRDHRFWIPLMSLFSGARMGELAQLTVDDVIEMDGKWFFRITDESSAEQRLKTKASQRIVPVHDQLIQLGLIRHLEDMKQRREEWLFPEIISCTRGTRSGKMSDFYRKYVKRIGVKTDKTVNFHSFRHGFTDALRRSGHLDHQFAFLLGHTQNNVTGRYGALQEGDLRLRRTLIESVAYPGLDLSHLLPT